MWMGSWGERTDPWLSREVNDASIIYFQDFLCWIIWTHFLITRPEHTAICVWLLCETSNMRSPAGAKPREGRRKIAVSPMLLRAPWDLNWSLQQSLLELTSPTQQCVSVASTKFSRRKWNCEVPSLCHLWQDSMFTNQLWNIGSKFALEHDCERTTKNFKDQT